MKKYLIKIYTKHLQTKFFIYPDHEITDIQDIHKYIIDNLGKNGIEWEPNRLKFTGGFYITYEEVNDGKQHDVTLRKEDTA